jgi:DNA-binding SARP family transcriptional activator/tetratricopeptide (TPR) repeat protein
MDFRVLGPVEVWRAGAPLRLGGPKARGLLATLLLEAGKVVSVDRIIDLLWGDDPPSTAAATVQQYVSSLRRCLASTGRPQVITTSGRGYAIDVSYDDFDLAHFTNGMLRGRTALREGRAGEAAEEMRGALALWRGAPLAGAALATDTEAVRLEEERLGALEDRIEAELELGHAALLVPELTGLTRAHPLRERSRGQLMRALCQAGRPGDAIREYERGRHVLAEELGIDPGPALQQLYQGILRGETAHREGPTSAEVAPPASPGPAGHATNGHRTGPSLLPPDIGDFTGLRAETAEIVATLTAEGGTATPIAVISGKPGTGKTTLAVHVAHRLRERFPDGQLFATLRGSSPNPVDNAILSAGFLRALGLDPQEMPASAEERQEQLRLRLTGRRVLMVLDDAAGAEAVRTLLPGEPSCAVIITSRSRLTGIAGVTLVELNTWESAAATTLLGRIVGTERATTEPAAAARIAELCGGLPLAVRVAGARLAARPHWLLGRLAERLADERSRLDELTHGDLEVRASLALSVDGLSPAARQALRRLAMLEAPSVAVWVVAAMMSCPRGRAEDLVDELVDARLLDPIGLDATGQDRYRLHDLVRLFGRERAEAEEQPTARAEAVAGAVAAWLQLVNAAVERLPRAIPHLTTGSAPEPLDPGTVEALVRDPTAWFQTEAVALVAAVEVAAAHGLDQLACELAHALLPTRFAVVNAFESWWRTHEAALRAAERAGNRLGRATVHTGLGLLRYKQDRLEEARIHLLDALSDFSEHGHRPGQAVALYGIGSVHFEQAEFPDGLSRLRQAADLFTELADPESGAHAWYLMGAIHRERGEDEAALAWLGQALEVYRRVGNRRGQGLTIRGIGLVRRARGQLPEALRLFHEAQGVFDEIGDRILGAYAAQAVAKTLIRLDRTAEAETLLAHTLAVTERHQDRFGVALGQRTLGELHLASGRPAAAAEHLASALETWRALGQPLWQARTQRDLAAVLMATGQHGAAHELWTLAGAAFAAIGARDASELTGWRARHACHCRLD